MKSEFGFEIAHVRDADVGAHVREQLGAGGPRLHVGEVEDLDAV